MTGPESQDSSFSYEEKHGKNGEIIKKLIEALRVSDVALTLDELKLKIGYGSTSDSKIENAIIESGEIKHKNIGQVTKEFNLKKYSFMPRPKMRIFYLYEEQIENFAKKSPYYSP